MKLIAAVDQNWAIGKDGKLLVSIPEDMKLFRGETTGKVIVMGRKTLESFPNGKPLKNRINIVLTTDKNYHPEDVILCRSLKELFQELEKYNSNEIYVIGGGKVYEQLVSYCDTALITKVEFAYDADTFFPNLEKMENWKETESSEEKTYYDLEYYFKTYQNMDVCKMEWRN